MIVPPPPHDETLTPLMLMLALMREKWVGGDRDGAVKLACAAAPYLHQRRATVTHNAIPAMEAHRLSDADLRQRLARPAGGTQAAAGDP